MRADAGDFDHRRFWDKAYCTRRVFDRIGHRSRSRLADGTTFFADQEYDGIIALVAVHACNEGVPALDTVHQFLESVYGL